MCCLFVWEFWVFKLNSSGVSGLICCSLLICKASNVKCGSLFWAWVKCVCVLCVCSQVSCPYSEMNLNKEGLPPDRLSGERPLALSGPHPRGRRPDPQTNTTTQASSAADPPEGAEDSQNRSAAVAEHALKAPCVMPAQMLQRHKRHRCSSVFTFATRVEVPWGGLYVPSTFLIVAETRNNSIFVLWSVVSTYSPVRRTFS